MSAPRLYLDNAATSFPKPEAVYAAVDHYQRELGTAVGRGSSRAALEVQRVVQRCRARAARMFGTSHSEQVIFTSNGTDALNLALHGMLQPGDRVLTTCWEHNSVRRPLADLRNRLKVETVIAAAGERLVDLDFTRNALREPCRLVVVTHASNVTGELLPVRELAQQAHAAGALVLLDAAQTAGHLPVNMNDLDVDIIALPGHKGLMGPLGTGLLVLREGLAEQLRPMRQGGTGTSSESDEQPVTLPERFESGNLNAPGIFGLDAALQWHEEHSTHTGAIDQLFRQFVTALQQLPNVQVHRQQADSKAANLVSITLPTLPPQVLSTLLEEHFGIESRAGLHCAPGSHAQLGTLATGGTVRLSAGHFTTADQLDTTLEALAQIATAM